MIDTDDLRRSLESLADKARPVSLGRAALDGARRRRRRRRIGMTVVLLLLAGALVPITLLNPRQGTDRPVVDLPVGPMGPHLVTAYTANQKWYVVDPYVGRYRQVDGGSVTSVSPNLELYTDMSTLDGLSSVLRITPTSGTGPDAFHTIAGTAVHPLWSPDGNWLAVPLIEDSMASDKPSHGFTEIVFVDVLNGTTQRKKIQLGDRYGDWVQWVDDSTLLVGTERVRYQDDGVAMVRRDGKMLSWHPLPPAEPCVPRPMALPPSHDGKLLICANDGPAQVYRVFDPASGRTGPELGRISLPPDTRAIPASWQGGDELVLQVSDLNGDGTSDVRVARLSTGTLEKPQRGLPDPPYQLLVGSSDGLSAAGWKLTF